MVMAEQTVLVSPLLGEAKAALCAIRRAVDEGFKKSHCGV